MDLVYLSNSMTFTVHKQRYYFKGAGGGLWVPTLEIEFLDFLHSREQELPAAFYRIKKYCS